MNDKTSSAIIEMISPVNAARCKTNDNGVTFFEHANFRGACKVLGIGTYKNSAAMGIMNDTVSSIIVGKNVQVLVCKHSAYAAKGAAWFNNPNNCQRFSASKESLSGSRIGNDSISSTKIVVRKTSLRAPGRCYPGDTSNKIAVYEHPNLGGRCQVLPVGDYRNSVVMNFQNDVISSIEFGKKSKLRVTACQHRDFGGRCEKFVATELNLRDNRIGDNTITSISVGRRR